MIHSVLDKKSLDTATNLITDGKIIIYPTDTLYGFGVDATNSKAIQNLNNLKKRIQPYSIIVSSFEMLEKYAEIDKYILKKIKSYLPGPYTVILKVLQNDLSNLINPNISTIAIRIPRNRFIINVIEKINKPIVTTSVNSHNELPLNEINKITKKYPKINIFKDNNININSKGSTIIDCNSAAFRVIRIGDGII